MIWLGSLAFNAFFYAWTALVVLTGLPYLAVSGTAAFRAGRIWALGLIAGVRVLCGIRHRVEGLENLPHGPFIFAAKHQSTWDILACMVVLHHPYFVVKKELLSVPGFGWYLKRSRMIAVDRKGGSKALRAMIRQAAVARAAGAPIVIYPEGTRVAPGASQPFRPGVAALYSELKVPVVPASLDSGRFWGRRSFLKRPGTITLRILPPIPAGLPRREFLDRLRHDIESASDSRHALAAARVRT